MPEHRSSPSSPGPRPDSACGNSEAIATGDLCRAECHGNPSAARARASCSSSSSPPRALSATACRDTTTKRSRTPRWLRHRRQPAETGSACGRRGAGWLGFVAVCASALPRLRTTCSNLRLPRRCSHTEATPLSRLSPRFPAPALTSGDHLTPSRQRRASQVRASIDSPTRRST